MLEMIRALLKREEGQGMVEYGLILVLVSVVAITTLVVLGTDVSGVFNAISQTIQAA